MFKLYLIFKLRILTERVIVCLLVVFVRHRRRAHRRDFRRGPGWDVGAQRRLPARRERPPERGGRNVRAELRRQGVRRRWVWRRVRPCRR